MVLIFDTRRIPWNWNLNNSWCQVRRIVVAPLVVRTAPTPSLKYAERKYENTSSKSIFTCCKMFFLLISLSSSLLLAICAVAVPTGNTPTISFDTTLTWIPITNATHNIATVSQSRLLSLKAATADDISERSTTFSAPATDFGPGVSILESSS